LHLPPGQQLAAPDKWPAVGERAAGPGPIDWSLLITGAVAEPLELSLPQLQAMPATRLVMDVHCVTRWTKPAVEFVGVLLADLLRLVAPHADARYVSFVARSLRAHSTSLTLDEALSLGTLVAWQAQGVPLPPEHGGPLRTVVPQRYFYKSLKWLTRIELLTEDRLGHWEQSAGYHNHADPWREERFLAATLSRQETAQLLAGRDFSQQEILSLAAAGHDLTGLQATNAVLRNADFRGARLVRACFAQANLSNARFAAADLRDATFVGADVEGADFCRADLRGTDLRGASLTGASFWEPGESYSGARLDGSTRVAETSLDDLTPLQAEFVRSFLTFPPD